MQHPATHASLDSHDPHTPTDIFLGTPSLASPGTPHQADPFLHTPADKARSRAAAEAEIAMSEDDDESGMEGVEQVGLGYGKVGSAGPAVQGVELRKETPASVKGFPDAERLRGMKRRFEEIEHSGEAQIAGNVPELQQMVQSLLTPCLEDLPFLQEQLAAQRETIRTMQQQARLSQQLITLERERVSAERQSWRATTDALLKQQDGEIASASKPKRLLDLDVGYHQELEAANKRLEMDNRLMAPRLADTQRQIDRLVTELQHLRSQVVLSSHHFDVSAEASGSQGFHPPSLPQHPPSVPQAMPSTHREEQPRVEGMRRSKSPSKAMRTTTMGDARSEHLLLAARKVRAMRQVDDRVGRLTLDELKRGGVVGPDGGLGYSEGYGGVFLAEEDEDEGEESDLEEKPFISERRVSSGGTRSKGKIAATPMTAKGKKGKRPPTTPGNQKSTRQPLTTPGGSNFTDLLRAAEMATRPTTPTPQATPRLPAVPVSATSATRSTHYPTLPREESPTDSINPTKKARRMWVHPSAANGSALGLPNAAAQGGAGADDDNEESALDLLLQASQIGPGGRGKSPVKGNGNADKAPSAPRGLAPPLELRQMSATPIADHMIDPSLADPPAPRPPSTTATPLASASTSTPALVNIATPRQRPRNISNASNSLAEITTPARNWSMYQDSPFDQTPSGVSPPPQAKRERGPNRTPLHSELGDLNAFNSPTGGTVPGLGKYVHLTSSMPARRIRSPYLKWTVEEVSSYRLVAVSKGELTKKDELLARAVALHGEKWDLVSKGVPTRSYHQVRQRWLRKTGAFDKKPSGGMDQAVEDGESRERAVSPTPASGQGKEGGKKRKMSLIG